MECCEWLRKSWVFVDISRHGLKYSEPHADTEAQRREYHEP